MYNCKKCPGYCCSYPLIALNKRDVERLAKHFRLSFRTAKAKFTVTRWGETVTAYPRSLSETFTDLARAGFRIETLLEPRPSAGAGAEMPTTVIWRARKEGS